MLGVGVEIRKTYQLLLPSCCPHLTHDFLLVYYLCSCDCGSLEDGSWRSWVAWVLPLEKPAVRLSCFLWRVDIGVVLSFSHKSGLLSEEMDLHHKGSDSKMGCYKEEERIISRDMVSVAEFASCACVALVNPYSAKFRDRDE
jgi:hypothetical protein